MKKSYEEINEKIRQGKAVVLTAEEVSQLARTLSPAEIVRRVDVVTTGTFGAMCSSGAFLNFGHATPPIRMERIELNGVPVSGGLAAVDTFVGATDCDPARPAYGGAHVIEELVAGRSVTLEAWGKGTDDYPRRHIRSHVTLDDINEAILYNPRNCYQNYNRIGYDGKVISSQGDYKRNEIATKLLKNKYGLTYAEDKGKTNVEKLHASERVKYEIFNAVKAALKHSKTWKEFNDYLLRRGIRLEFVKRTREIKRTEDIQGIRFTKDGQTFKASQISREFSFARLNAQLSWKPSETQQESEHRAQQRIPDGGHLLESTGPGLFSPTNGTSPEEPLSQEELLRRRRKKKRRKGLGL